MVAGLVLVIAGTLVVVVVIVVIIALIVEVLVAKAVSSRSSLLGRAPHFCFAIHLFIVKLKAY